MKEFVCFDIVLTIAGERPVGGIPYVTIALEDLHAPHARIETLLEIAEARELIAGLQALVEACALHTTMLESS